MKPLWALVIIVAMTAPALAQTQQPAPVPNPPVANQPVTSPAVASPFQALANVLHNPDAPRPPPPSTVTSEPLQLPTAIPPNTTGR